MFECGVENQAAKCIKDIVPVHASMHVCKDEMRNMWRPLVTSAEFGPCLNLLALAPVLFSILSNVHKNLYCLVPLAPLGCVDGALGSGCWEARTQTNKSSNTNHWHSKLCYAPAPYQHLVWDIHVLVCSGWQNWVQLILGSCSIENDSFMHAVCRENSCSGKRRPWSNWRV